MTNAEHPAGKVHHGRNIKRFREMFGLKQEALALELGDDWSQKKVSRLEENETVEDAVLEQVAKILKVPVKRLSILMKQRSSTLFQIRLTTTIMLPVTRCSVITRRSTRLSAGPKQ